MTGVRLKNANLMEQMKTYEMLLGGQVVWGNTILVLTKQDFNPLECELDEWKESLEEKE